MTTLMQQIEEMRIRMNALATEEHGLVRALGDALAHADEKLLQEVRAVAIEHEARRGATLNELQTLAARMCMLPKQREPFVALESTPLDAAPRETEPVVRGGDWRQAAANIQEELAFHLKIRASAG